jgi:uncharacterized membrane protein YfcA
MLVLLYLIIGMIAGSLLGAIGTGAGLVIVPALIFLAHFSGKTAIGTSLALLLPPLGLFAAFNYWKHGHVNVLAAIVIMIGFIIGSYFAARVAVNMPDATLERVFGVVAIAIGAKMLLSA